MAAGEQWERRQRELAATAVAPAAAAGQQE